MSKKALLTTSTIFLLLGIGTGTAFSENITQRNEILHQDEAVLKPTEDKINALNQEIQQVDQPYREQIRERNEEQRRITRETWHTRDQIQELNESSWHQKKTLREDEKKLEQDRLALRQLQMQNKAHVIPLHPSIKIPPQHPAKLLPISNQPPAE
jgi:chromosome segregation ATPase